MCSSARVRGLAPCLLASKLLKDREIVSEVASQAPRLGHWCVAIIGSQVNDRWDVKITGPRWRSQGRSDYQCAWW